MKIFIRGAMGKLPPPFYILAVVVLACGGIPKGSFQKWDPNDAAEI